VRPLFADTFFYLALLNPDDAAHRRVEEISRTVTAPTITTAWVMTEVGDALAGPMQRPLFLALLEELGSDPNVTLVPATQDLFNRGIDLFARRPDKEWSVTDCISFVVMRDHGLTEALTGDRHFEQAGFRALLAQGSKHKA
jgi:predicted nucleic acid-binding protein